MLLLFFKVFYVLTYDYEEEILCTTSNIFGFKNRQKKNDSSSFSGFLTDKMLDILERINKIFVGLFGLVFTGF